MGEKSIDPRYSAAFQRHTGAKTRPMTAAGAPVAARPFTPEPLADSAARAEALERDAHPDERERTPRGRLLWTIALFLIGAGLCAASFALYSEFNFLRWTNATPISGTDQWVISDGTGYGTRTVDQFDVVFPRYMSQMSIWIGGIGIATIVMNFFRLAAGRSQRR